MSKENKKITRLSDLNQIDGKLEKVNIDGSFAPSTLDELFGVRLNKYNTTKLDEYLQEINGKNMAELQTHAINLGLVPNRDRVRLIKQLTLAFNKYIGTYSKPTHLDSNVRLADTKIGKSKLETALKIMSAVK